jgi:hypothetical protein
MNHDNARPHTSLRTGKAVGWTVLPHAPYSPDLSPPDFQLFGLLRDAFRRRRFADDSELKTPSVKSSDASANIFTPPAYSVSRKVGKSVLVMKETLWKNNRNFVKDVPMTYVNFIIIVIVSQKK